LCGGTRTVASLCETHGFGDDDFAALAEAGYVGPAA
jgi:hypothetical protein